MDISESVFFKSELMPAIFMWFIILIFILIAVCYNFIPMEENRNIDNFIVIPKKYITNIDGIKFDSIGKIHLLEQINTCEYTLIVTKDYIEPDLIEPNNLIYLTTDSVYSLILPEKSGENIKVTIINNSNTIKNIRCINLVKMGDKDAKMITMGTKEILQFEFIKSNWQLIDKSIMTKIV